MQFTLYTANCTGNAQNSLYPNRVEVCSPDDMLTAIARDHVCAQFRNSHRSLDHYLGSDVDVLDCDNDHSDNPKDWISPEMYEELFPDVDYVVVPSRNNNKPKGGKSARPRHHVYFPHNYIAKAEECTDLKRRIHAIAPSFDANALDAARFIFGCTADDIIWHEGGLTIDDFLDEQAFAELDQKSETIDEGSRNTTMSHFAGKLVKRYGDTEEAYQIFLDKAQRCSPPLPQDELDHIWNSAKKFGQRVKMQDGYIDPKDYNKMYTLRPEDYSDIGQAKVLAREFAEELAFTDATDYMRYNGTHWVESKQMAVGTCEDFLDLQLTEADTAAGITRAALIATGVDPDIIAAGGKALEKAIDARNRPAYQEYCTAQAYHKFVMKRRDMKYILTAMQAAKPMLLRDIKEFDTQEFLLNTPDATYDLRKGINGRQEHRASDLITKITAVSPDNENEDLWLDALNGFFCSDRKLIDYVQQIVGLTAIGKVYMEALIIAYGDGSNGKSTLWNAIASVLGSYSGTISADALTIGCKRNVKPEMAELKGKRLVIAAELEEGTRLNTGMIKQLCSMDDITAEKKYKDSFHYTPTHTLVLYTNHLPRVGANDKGTWRRLIVIPFKAKIEGQSDVKNYADYLVKNAGGAILTWIIEGAEKVIQNHFKIAIPTCVEAAIDQYKQANDWLSIFIEEECEVDPTYKQKSGEFYQEYRAYCARTGEFARSTADFYTGLESAGFKRKKSNTGAIVVGIRLKSDFLEN